MPDETELWVVAWRGRGRDKHQAFEHKADAPQLVRDLLATDTDLVVLSRERVTISFTVAPVKGDT